MGLSRPSLAVHPFRATWYQVPWWRWAVRAVVAVVAAIAVLTVVTFCQVWWVGREDHRPTSDTLVVLGASQYNGRPSAVFAARLDHALELYRQGVAPNVITIGGKQPGDRYTEAEAGAAYLRRRGIPADRVIVIPEGSDTLGSLTAVAGVMNTRRWRSTVLVTDPWHSLRSRTMARDLGLDAATSPVTRGPAVHGVDTKVRYIIREGIGYRWYQLFHRASPPSATTRAV
ncbi:YdcF family protein [Candidatus Frankia alpina]|uniref:YdcF family protein n=1 Tax=Candidatus Frankia alpina TaxID=2699483 RepID=A0A4S5ETW5_9ACTN|nr:YdcF family protein [Candidatus Frankia alpina]THJ75941.1 YdcF family protein [Candidatus Frankia alpina]